MMWPREAGDGRQREAAQDSAGAGRHEQQTEARRADVKNILREDRHELGVGHDGLAHRLFEGEKKTGERRYRKHVPNGRNGNEWAKTKRQKEL